METLLKRIAPLLTVVCLIAAACTVWIAHSTAYAVAAGAQLVNDVNAAPDDGFSNYGFQSFNGAGYFIGYTPTTGSELWRTDGTSAGTYMVKDTVPGTASGNIVFNAPFNTPSGATSTGFFFRASTSAVGAELWFSDGTESGTNLVKDIYPGSTGSNPGMGAPGCDSCGLVVLNDVAYFPAQDSNGIELWRSDGTSAGTYMVKDLNTSTASASSSPYNLTLFGGGFLFSATDATNGQELWISDGTAAGTTLLKDVRPGTSNGLSPSANMVVSGGIAYFSADDGTTGRELFRTDGTSAGTTLVKDIQPGTTGASTANVTPYNGGVVFYAQDPTAGFEPFFSDGTSAGTAVIKDINPGVSSSAPLNTFSFKAVGSRLLFSAKTALNGDELWATDGTSNGTYMVTDIAAGTTSGITSQYVSASNDKLYFPANDQVNGSELWVSDATSGGTFMVKDVAVGSATSGAVYPMAMSWGVIFGGFQSATGRELWRSDGTSSGTYLVKEIAASTASGYSTQSTVYWGCMGTRYFFNSNSKVWTTDGTSAGTVGAGTSVPSSTENFNGGTQTFFIAATASTGSELWRTDGTDAGTYMVKDINAGSGDGATGGSTFSKIVVGGILYFQGNDNGAYGIELWRSDGTSAGTYLVKDIYAGATGSSPRPLANVNGKLFFTASTAAAGFELWTSDGTSTGTTMVKDINVGATTGVGSLQASVVAVVDNKLYFIANNGSTGNELWVSDGTSAGTTLVADITSGSASTTFGSFSNAGGRVWFTATTTAAGQELWTSDGTSAGTYMVKDIYPGTTGSSIAFLGALGTNVMFRAVDGVNGQELWTSDGTSSGTVMVADINPGSANGVTTSFPGATLNGVFYFPGFNAADGGEVWATDLTSGGAQMVTNLGPGNVLGYYTGLTTCGSSQLYFIGNDGTAGYEPYIVTGMIGSTPTTTTTVAPTTTTVAPTTTTVAPTTTTTVAPTTTTTVAPTTTLALSFAPAVPTTTVAKTPYKDWTASLSASSVRPGDKFTLEVSVTCPNKMNNRFNTGTPTGTPLFKFDLVSLVTSKVVGGGGWVWGGTQVLSNNDYTVTWTRSVTAPATSGDYSVQVYSVGATADYIYCRILPMNTRHDGPETSLTVRSVSPTATTTTTSTTSTTSSTTTVAPTSTTSTTTVAPTTAAAPTTTRAPVPQTTTTLPPLPVEPGLLERVDPSRPVAIISGQPSVVDLVERPASLELTVRGVVATIGGVSGGNNPLALNASSEVEVTTDESVRFTLEGFLPNSRVGLWVYTRDKENQKYFGTFSADDHGVLSEEIEMQVADVTGSVDLVISGTNADGEKITLGVPMQVLQVAETNGFVASLLAALLFAVGSYFLFRVLRRRDDGSAMLRDHR